VELSKLLSPAVALCALQLVSSASADTGAVHVEVDQPAIVTLDDQRLGPAPLDVQNLAPGPHLVELELADGRIRRKVTVQAGQTETLSVETPAVFRAARYRRGIHALLGVGAFGLLEFNGGRGIGGQLTVGFNVGFTPRHELRVVALLGGGPYGQTTGNQTYGFELGLRPSYRKNIRSRYAIELGARLSFLQTWYRGRIECEGNVLQCPYATVSFANLAMGPDLSMLSARLGERKQYELTLSGAALFVPLGLTTAFAQISLTFSYLFLESEP
jgi:hypothetical protein